MHGDDNEVHWEAPPRPRLLLVDDDAGMRRSAMRFLARAGFDVLDVESGMKALDILDAGERFDAAVIDLEMPGMNGVQVMAAIKRRQPELPMGIWSANVGVDTGPEVDLADAWFVVSKLDAIGVLVQAVAKAIYGARAAGGPAEGRDDEHGEEDDAPGNGSNGQQARSGLSSYRRTQRPPPMPTPFRLQC